MYGSEKTDCGNMVTQSNHQMVISSKFTLKRQRDEQSSLKCYKARMFVCDIENSIYHEDGFFLVAKLTINKYMGYIGLNKGWTEVHIVFENAFINKHLDHSVYTKLAEHLYFKINCSTLIMKLNSGSYRLR